MEEDVNEMFEQILRDASKDDEDITDVEDLEQEVLDFIVDNVDIGKVLEETSQDAPEMDFNKMTEESCVEYFNAIVQQTKMPISIVSSQILARQVMNVVNSNINESAEEISPLLHPTLKERVKTLLSFIKQFKMKRQSYFDSLHFIHNLSRKEIPLELMFMLDETSVVNFQTCFTSWLADEEWLADFQSSVVSLCCHGDKEDVDVRRRILEVVTSNLLRLGYHGESNEITEQVKKSTRKILSNIIRLLEKQIETFKNDEKIEQWWICFLELVRKCNEIPTETRHDFLQEVLTDWVMGSNTSTLENAFISQHKWTFELLLSSIKTNFAQVVMALQDNEIIQTIDNAIESGFINVKALCHLVTVFLTVKGEGAYKLFDDFLQQCLRESFENNSTRQFHMVILLRRQLSQEGHISLPYSSWFEQTFVRKGPSFLEINTKKSIHFIFKSLTELVPHDQPEFLKIHVIKSAQISSKFRENIDDYISLAKTRLRELNIPMEENTGLFSQCSTTNEEMKVMEQAMEDVEKCLAIYDESGKIPITVMEASIFRKPYFIGRFLPSLLTPRKPTNDVRSRFIDDLNRAGKIPAPMFKSYERKCENWEDYTKDVELLDNVQKLSKFLTKLPNILIAMLNTSDINQVDLKSWLSGLSRKLKAFFGHQEFTNIGTVDVTVVTSKMEKEHFEVSHAVMNVFCRACAAVQSSRSENEDQSIKYKFDWVLKFLSIILTFPSLVQCLYVHLWSSICVESHLLSAEHTHGLAILVCHLSTVKTPCKIHFQGNFKLDVAPEPTIHQTLVDLIYAELSVKSKTLLQFYLRFSFQYLQYALVLFEDVTTDTGKLLSENHRTFGCAYVPLGMCKKMDYLFNKLKFRTGECEENDLLKSDEANLFEVLMKTIKDKGFLKQSYTMKQWLIWELQITEDTLNDNERLQYYYWIIYEKFIVALEDENTCMVYRKIAQEIILSLFQCWTSSDSANDERNNGSLPTEKHLIKILQDILNISGSSPTQSNVADTQSWFLVFMETIFDEIETDDESSKELSLRSKVMAFVRISTQLPPSFLLSSFETGSENHLQRETILSLSQFLNKYLKPSLFADFVLPFDFTVYILKCFLSFMKSSDPYSRSTDMMLRSLTKSSSIVFASIMFYWNQLKPLCWSYLSRSSTLQQFSRCQDFLSTFDNTTSWKNIFNESCDEMGLAYAILLFLTKKLKSHSFDVDVFTKSFNSILESLLAHKSGKEVIFYLFGMMLEYLSKDFFHFTKKPQQNMVEEFFYKLTSMILVRFPGVLCIFNEELHPSPEVLRLRTAFFGKTIKWLMPVVFFKIVTRLDSYSLYKESATNEFTHTILLMYISCVDLYENWSEPKTEPPLTLETFMTLSRYTKDFLLFSESTVLQKVDKGILMRLPNDIKRYFPDL